MSAEILRKVTIKGCGWSMAAIKAATAETEEGQTVDLLKVVGRTTSARKGQTDKGEYTLLGGDFFAVNLATGETFQSGKCILPNFISETLAAALADSPACEFGLLIGAKNAPDSVTGYEFTVRPVVEAKRSESLAALMDAAGIDPNAPRLEAPPKAEPEKRGPGRPAKAKTKE